MRNLIITLLLPSLAVILVGISFAWWNTNIKAPSSETTLHPFVIQPGSSATTIANKLEKGGFIKSSLAFRIYTQIQGKADKIKAGDYRLSKDKTLPNLINELTRGPIAVWVTLPEGLRREEIAARIVYGLGIAEQEKQSFVEEFLRLTKSKEGFLFPDTYLFLKTSTPEIVVSKLTNTFDVKVEEEVQEAGKERGLNLNELATLASLVERETRTDEERSVVADILLKRLDSGWALQADATLQYAIGNVKCQMSNVKCEWWPKVTADDKTIKSPYNTYTNRGLPPSPIANPGLSSIKAAASADRQTPYWFYLHDKGGNIHYARTIEEHQENIRNYLR